jgi:hypothetical protein
METSGQKKRQIAERLAAEAAERILPIFSAAS